jgi:uncharacterized DUF497 family protein
MYFYIDLFYTKAILGMFGTTFEWDPLKDLHNSKKHGISFMGAQTAFLDPRRVISKDYRHSLFEDRFYCFGKVSGMVLTVRFTFRNNRIRIIGAGFWRAGREIYAKENY